MRKMAHFKGIYQRQASCQIITRSSAVARGPPLLRAWAFWKICKPWGFNHLRWGYNEWCSGNLLHSYWTWPLIVDLEGLSAIFFSRQVLDFFWGFLVICFPVSLIFCFSASLLFCFSAFLLLCFSASLLFCFSAFLLLCFSASLLFCFSSFPASLLFCFSAFCFPCFSAFPAFLLFAFPASLLFCFSVFPASLLLYFCAFLLLLFYLFFSSVMCFCCSTSCSFASLLPVFTVFLFFIFFCPIMFCLSPKWNPRETLGETQRNPKEILIRNPTWKPKWTLKKP